jgi:hypothetical protein
VIVGDAEDIKTSGSQQSGVVGRRPEGKGHALADIFGAVGIVGEGAFKVAKDEVGFSQVGLDAVE